MRRWILAAMLAPVPAAAASAIDEPWLVQTEAGGVRIERIAELDSPWGLAFLPDGRLLVTEKPGRLRILAERSLSDPVGAVPEVAYAGQGGLLDVAIDPDFARNRTIYLSYVERAKRQPLDSSDPVDPRLGDVSVEGVWTKRAAVMRAQLGDSRLSWRRVIWRQSLDFLGRGQYGGRLAFAPDGTLFISGGDRQRFDPAQDTSNNIGAVVRIRRDGSIPPDNPFAKRRGARPDIWSFGHRNALGLAFAPDGTLWEHEMGPQGGDEFNRIERGGNYGWPIVSNGDNYDNTPIPSHSTRQDLIAPILSWTPCIAPSGLVFYDGALFADWQGDALIGGLASMSLWRLRLEEGRVVHQERIEIGERVRDVAVAPDGAVIVAIDGPSGGLYRLTPSVVSSVVPADETHASPVP